MKRIDLIYNAIKDLDKGEGVTTLEISAHLNLERSNVSKDLNLLVNRGDLYKNSSRPVRYFLNNPNNTDFSIQSSMDTITYLYPSLNPAFKLAKTAILYPPNGMNALIIGETGVGKSMLATSMHEFANTLDNNKNMPFLHFNCSDYSNNPQLLSAQLFGVKKGTFTGANEDRPGLIEQADGGILFLDEIHNLPSEGQEMLFVFMDTGYFTRFGEVSKKRKSSARIICATNKDINSALLDTFIRRIPIKIFLPNLNERLLEERLTLIEYFFKEESIKLDKPIYVSYNVMLCLLSYECKYNVGQLKNDIILIVANSYSDYFINNKRKIKINTPDLSVEIKEKLQNPLIKERELLDSLESNNRYFCYDKNTQIISHSFLKQKHKILSSFKDIIKELDGISTNKDIAASTIKSALDNYLDTIIYNMDNYHFNFTYSAFKEVIENISLIDSSLKTAFTDSDLKSCLNIHLDMIYSRINLIDFNPIPTLNRIKGMFPKSYELALNCKLPIEQIYNINLSNLELLFLTSFIAYILIE